MRATKTAAVLLAAALAGSTATAASADARPASRTDLQRSLDGVVAAGALGVQAEVVDERGVWRGVSGSARLDGRRPVPRQGRFRIGSTTKTFTATVVLQLVAEKKVELDAPAVRYLPGLLPRGERITVRQLLDHTSGLREYLEDGERFPMLGRAFLDRMRFAEQEPEELARVGVGRGREFAPGTGSRYSNTAYVLAGLIVEKVTGRSYAGEVERRIIRPLGLRNTSLPGSRTSIPGPHAHGYIDVGAERVDVTRLNPSWGWAAGEMISTTGDLNRFFGALLGGRLLPPAQLAEMRRTAPFPNDIGQADGLGIVRTPLSCGVRVWGKDGAIHGFTTETMHSEDGRRHITVSVNTRSAFGPGQMDVVRAVHALADKAFCGGS